MYHGWPGGTTKTVWQCACHVYFIFEKNCDYGSVFVCVSVYMYISMFVCVRLSKHLKDQLGPPLSDEKCLSVTYLFIHSNVFVYSQQHICLFTTTSWAVEVRREMLRTPQNCILAWRTSLDLVGRMLCGFEQIYLSVCFVVLLHVSLCVCVSASVSVCVCVPMQHNVRGCDVTCVLQRNSESAAIRSDGTSRIRYLRFLRSVWSPRDECPAAASLEYLLIFGSYHC